MKTRIFYHHTDCGGVVYYANYLKFLEEARTEFLEERGILIKDLVKNDILFVVARQEIDYKLPAFYGDILQTDTRLADSSRYKLVFEYRIMNQNNAVICVAKTVLVCVNGKIKIRAIPDEIKEKLPDFL